MNSLSKEGNLTPSSSDKHCQMWVDLMVQIPKATTKWSSLKSPNSKVIKFFYEVSIHKWTEIVILALTFVNLLVLAIDFEGAPRIYEEKIAAAINNTTTIIFIIEAIVKLIGLSPKGYFESLWNRFDFFIVCASLIDVCFIISNSINTDSNSVKFLKTFQILRILRMIRVTR